tara:strand:+ start:6798 stop:7457 length:660 start_codon:yes stop_codon:yes gene_type:complete
LDVSSVQKRVSLVTPWIRYYENHIGRVRVRVLENSTLCIYDGKDVQRSPIEIRDGASPIRTSSFRTGDEFSDNKLALNGGDEECRKTLAQDKAKPYTPYLEIGNADLEKYLGRHVSFEVPPNLVHRNHDGGYVISNTGNICAFPSGWFHMGGKYLPISTNIPASIAALTDVMNINDSGTTVTFKGTAVHRNDIRDICFMPHKVEVGPKTYETARIGKWG